MNIKKLNKMLEAAEASGNRQEIEMLFKKLFDFCRFEEWDSSNSDHQLAYDLLIYICQKYGNEWDDLDPRYPNNTYHWGYECFDEEVILNYSGVCGCYWDTIIRN